MTDQTTDPLRETLRRVLAEADGFSYESLEPHDYQKHVDAVLAVLPAPFEQDALLPAWEAVYEPGNVSDYLIGYANDQDPATGMAEAWLRSQAEVTGRLEWVNDEQMATGRYDRWFELIERHDDGVDTGPGIIVRRRMADETAATETGGAQRLCGKDRGVSGLYYRPCARAAGHKEAYCRSADGGHLFLAAPPMDPVHILGIDADDERASGARQDGAQPGGAA